MPFVCDYCKKALMSAGSLKMHIKTAKSCLKIQNSLGIEAKACEFKCLCGSEFTLKCNFNRHCDKCPVYQAENNKKSISNTANTTTKKNTEVSVDTLGKTYNSNQSSVATGALISTGDNNVNTVQNITNIYINTMSSDYVFNKLKSIMTEKIFTEGMPSVVKNIIDGLLLVDHKYIYYCSDRSRSSFKMLCMTSAGEIIEDNDPEAVKLRNLLQAPIRLLITSFKEKNDDHELNDISESFQNLTTDGADFKRELKTNLPSSSLHIEHVDTSAEEMNREIERRELALLQREKQKKIKTSEDYMNKLIDNTTQYYEHKSQYYDSCWRNDITHYVMGLKNRDPYIIGYSNSLKGEMMKLTKTHLTDIKKHNIERYLDPQYINDIKGL